jgi:hypothetical protein
VRARATAMSALFFVLELSVVNLEHARASALAWQRASPAKSCTAADSKIVQISNASENIYFPISRETNGRIVDWLILHFNNCPKSGANYLLRTAKAGSHFRVNRPPIGLTIFSNKNSIREHAKLGIGFANVPNAHARPHRLSELENGLTLIQMTQGYVDDANSRPVSQKRRFCGQSPLDQPQLGR